MDYKSLCILGRQPSLGVAELESLYGADNVKVLKEHALLKIPAEEINFKRLGGTIKTARILNVIEPGDWRSTSSYLKKTVPEHAARLPEGKLTLGLSAYGLKTSVKDINGLLLELKKLVKKSGRPVRVVPNKTPELNSAQVLHNQLTHRGGWELVLVQDGQRVILAQTLFVQDIEAYGARDQARPKRDARVGMLPPKLAQIMVNLATSKIEQKIETGNRTRVRVLDPFCGTGVVLQEALLMGYSVIGSDVEPRMVEYTKANLQWLVEEQPNIEGSVALEVADATNYTWPRFSTVASEVFLGRPLVALPAEDKLKEIINDANTITRKFLANLAPQLQTGQRIVLALPAWRRPSGQLIQLSTLAKITDMGYNYLDFKHVARHQLAYFREDQVVARQLIILEKV